MILLPRAVRIHVAVEPQNLRMSFEGLSNAVRRLAGLDPLSGHLFVFVNRRATQVKILVWTRGGFLIAHKRLERGRFAFAQRLDPLASVVEIDAHELSMLLEGLEPSTARGARRWTPVREQRDAS